MLRSTGQEIMCSWAVSSSKAAHTLQLRQQQLRWQNQSGVSQTPPLGYRSAECCSWKQRWFLKVRPLKVEEFSPLLHKLEPFFSMGCAATCTPLCEVISLLFSRPLDVFSSSVVSSQKPDAKPVMDSPVPRGHSSRPRSAAVQREGCLAHEVKHGAEDWSVLEFLSDALTIKLCKHVNSRRRIKQLPPASPGMFNLGPSREKAFC